LEAVGWVPRQRPHDGIGEALGNGRIGIAHVSRRCGGNGHGHLCGAIASERVLPRDGLVQHDAHGPDVRTVVDGLGAEHLLGRHVLRRAQGRLGLRELIALEHHLRDAEVHDLDDGRPAGLHGKEQVGRLEVAVHDSACVGLGHGRASLHDPIDGLGIGQRALVFERHREVVALEELHDDEGQTGGGFANVGDANDVRRGQLGGGAGLALEAHDGIGVLEGLGQKELEGDALAEFRVPRLVHDAHAALADLAEQLVLAVDVVAGLRPKGLAHDSNPTPIGGGYRKSFGSSSLAPWTAQWSRVGGAKAPRRGSDLPAH
jgi:hypothetical protein